MPSASAAIAKDMAVMVSSETAIMNGPTRRIVFVPIVNSSATSSSGVSPTQYLLQRSFRRSSGADLSSHR